MARSTLFVAFSYFVITPLVGETNPRLSHMRNGYMSLSSIQSVIVALIWAIERRTYFGFAFNALVAYAVKSFNNNLMLMPIKGITLKIT